MENPIAMIVADDLTGACDAAVAFASRGLETVVACGNSVASGGDVMALNTETRDAEGDLEMKVSDAAARLKSFAPRIAMKKVDSMFRGNSFDEIGLWVSCLPGYVGALAPALPGLGRIVRAGTLLAESKKLDLKQELHRRQIECESIPASGSAQLAETVQTFTNNGKRLLLFDAESEGDLARIAEAFDRCCQKVFWIGSSGLAAALAARLPRGDASLRKPRRRGSVMFCIGSDHVASRRQIAMLREKNSIMDLDASRQLEGLQSPLSQSKDVLLRIPYDYDDQIKLRHALKQLLAAGVAALVLSGGSTAAKVCHALGIDAMEIGGEVLPGIPWGVLRGGAAHGLPVITKSGGFGEPDALIAAAAFFRDGNKERDAFN